MNTDLQTLALRYALGELAGTEALEFETRLETDQAAREALADAVILSSAVRQLPRPSRSTAPVHQPAARRSRIAAMVSCAAACGTKDWNWMSPRRPDSVPYANFQLGT